MTLDLNGAVVVRAKSEQQASMTELLLSNSRKQGDELRVSTDRNYLTRAVQLGFREIHLRDPDLRAFCRSDRRAYLWAFLGKDAVLKGDTAASHIESPVRETQARGPKPLAPPVLVPASSSTELATDDDSSMPSRRAQVALIPGNGQVQSKSLTELIAEGEALRTTLRDVLARTRALISGLKQQRRGSKARRAVGRSPRSVPALSAD